MARVGKGRVSGTKTKERKSAGSVQRKEKPVERPEVKTAIAERITSVKCSRCQEPIMILAGMPNQTVSCSKCHMVMST